MDDEFDSGGVPSVTDPSAEAALERARYVAELMDSAFTIPGTDIEVGLDPLLGILPVSGDAVSGVVSLYIVGEAARAGVPKEKLVRMLANVGIDFAVGSIPVLGTVFDAFWKANIWNVSTMEEYVEEGGDGDEGLFDDGSDDDGSDDGNPADAVSIDIDEESDGESADGE